MRGDVHAGRPHLLSVNDPALNVVARSPRRSRLHIGGIRAMVWFSQAEGDAILSGDRAVDHGLLILAAVAVEHGHDWKIADDRMLVLQIVVPAQTFGFKMLADHGHPELGTIVPAIAPGQGKAQMPGGIGEVLGPAQQRFPFASRQSAALVVRTGPLTAMIEE